jgi:hypothetical protein
MTTIPKTEPAQIRAGDTWQWRREDLTVDYPAPTWTLSYVFKSATKAFSFDAAADGAFFAIEIAAAETGDYTAGVYRWAAQVVNGDERHTISTGTTEVLANVFEDPDVAADTRSWARKTLEAVEIAIYRLSSRIAKEYEINGRRFVAQDLKMLTDWRDRLQAEVASEDAPVGTPRRHTAYVRFGNVV